MQQVILRSPHPGLLNPPSDSQRLMVINHFHKQWLVKLLAFIVFFICKCIFCCYGGCCNEPQCYCSLGTREHSCLFLACLFPSVFPFVLQASLGFVVNYSLLQVVHLHEAHLYSCFRKRYRL